MCISKPSTGKKVIVKTRSGRPVRAKQHLPSSLAIVLDPSSSYPAPPVKKSSTSNNTRTMRTSIRSSAGRRKGGKPSLRVTSSLPAIVSASTSSSRQSFPSQLHHMLDDAERRGFDDIVSWQPHGRCFVVHKVKEFVEQILPNYFRQSKFPSFQRQLNLYEFSRITQGKDRNAYYHDRFLRGVPELSERMNRCKVKGTRVRHAPQPELEPDFYSYPPLSAKKSVSSSSAKKKNGKKKPRRSGGLPKSSPGSTSGTGYIAKKSMSKGLKIGKPLPFVDKKSVLVTPPDTPHTQEDPQPIFAQSLLLAHDDIAAEEPLIGLTSAPPATRDDLLAILEDAHEDTFASLGERQPPVLTQASPVRQEAANASWPSLEWPRDDSRDLSQHSTSMVTSTSNGTSSDTDLLMNTTIERVNSVIFFEGKPFHYMESDAIPLVCGHP